MQDPSRLDRDCANALFAGAVGGWNFVQAVAILFEPGHSQSKQKGLPLLLCRGSGKELGMISFDSPSSLSLSLSAFLVPALTLFLVLCPCPAAVAFHLSRAES